MRSYKELRELATGWNVTVEKSAEWWRLQDVDPDAVTRFCHEQAAEDVAHLAIYVLTGLMSREGVAQASIATAYEIGMIFGINLEQKRVANGLH